MRNPVTRDGLGYRWDHTREGIVLRADRLNESGDTLTAEVVAERAPQGHLVRTRINLLAAQTRASLAKQIAAVDRDKNVDWAALLERFFDGVLALEREGPPFERIGRRAVRPQPPFLLRPMLYAGKPTILFGEGGVGKSSLAAAVAVAVQTGVAALDAWQVMTSGNVLVLDWEGDGDDWNDATARVCAGLQLEPIELHYRRMRGPLDADIHRVAAYCDENEITLLIVDSLTWAAKSVGRGSADEPVKNLFDALRVIGRTSLLIDHKSKAAIADDQTTGASPIGSIVKVNAARATFELRRADDPDPDGTRHLALINHKQNPTMLQPPLGIAIRTEGAVVSMWSEPVRLGDAHVIREVAASGRLWERIRDLLEIRGPQTAPSIVGFLGMQGRDPARQVEQALGRKPTVFGSAGTLRQTRKWYLHGVHNTIADKEEAPPMPVKGQTEAFPRAENVGSRMAELFAGVKPHQEPPIDWADELQ